MGRVDSEKLQAAVDELYAAALAPELWPQALKALGDAVGGFGALVHAPDARSPWVEHALGFEEPARTFVAENWAGANFRTRLGLPLHRASRRIVHEGLLLSEAEIDRQPIQNEFFNRFGMRSFIGFEFTPGGLAASIERGREPLDPWELAILERFQPHFERIGALAAARARARLDGVLQGIDVFNRPVVALSADARVLDMTPGAERLVDEVFHTAHRTLIPRETAARPAFARLVGEAVQAGRAHEVEGATQVALRGRDGRLIVARAAPLAGPGVDVFQTARALLILADSGAHIPLDPAALRAVFDLTDTEARLTQIFYEGADIAEAASRLAVSVGTVRTHMKAIFRKTGASRQANLMSRLARLKDVLAQKPPARDA